MLGSDGGLARYRLRLLPWIWRLGQVRNSRVWQDKSVIDIVDAVFTAYQPQARWRWSGETSSFMARAMPRSYCCQYRETDLAFVQRLLAEEGLGWRCEQDGDACRHRPVRRQHLAGRRPRGCQRRRALSRRARSARRSDTVQSLIAQRRLHASLTTVLSANYKAKQAVAASSPTRMRQGSKLPLLESFDVPGQYAYANGEQAQRHADLQMQRQEARAAIWHGRSTVRTLRAGTRLTVTGLPLARSREAAVHPAARDQCRREQHAAAGPARAGGTVRADSGTAGRNHCRATSRTASRWRSPRPARPATPTVSTPSRPTCRGARHATTTTAASASAPRRTARKPPS